MITPPESPQQPTPRIFTGETIAVNAALLRLFKNEYRKSSDRHSDALLARDYVGDLTTRLAQAEQDVKHLRQQLSDIGEKQ